MWRKWRIIAISSSIPHSHPFLHFVPATRPSQEQCLQTPIPISTINIPPIIYLLPLLLAKAESEEVALIRAVPVGASAASILAGVDMEKVPVVGKRRRQPPGAEGTGTKGSAFFKIP